MSSELLDYHNVLIKSILTEALIENADKPASINQLVSDFDNANYHISTPEDPSRIQISLSIKAWPDLKRYGILDVLDREYGSLVQSAVEPGYDVSLLIDLNTLTPNIEERLHLIDRLSMLRRNALAAPFELAFSRFDKMAKEAAEAGLDYYKADPRDTEIFTVKYRGEGSIFIVPGFDRVTVIFSTVFQDETDQTFGKVFLQEFVDARKRAIQKAPQVLFSKDPPLEIRDTEAIRHARSDNSVGYITFVLFPAHITPQRREHCISHIQTFRDYFHFQIKSSKAFVHSRMRHRTDEFLKVLNRAKPEVAERERKTATGRRLVR